MIYLSPPKVVVLGMVTKMPVAGVVWQAVHYLEGLRRLGYDPYYVEAHSRTPSMFMGPDSVDGSEGAAAYLSRLMERFGFGDRWAYHALHSDGRCLGMDRSQLMSLYQSAELLLNLHGGTHPQPEHVETGRLVYVGTDPVQLEIELFHENQATFEFLQAHSHHFSFGENYGNPDCLLPVTNAFDLQPTRQPVVLDFWGYGANTGTFTTIGNWRQEIRDLRYRGETYTWSKHDQFLALIDLPSRTGADLELALASASEEDRDMIRAKGWRVRDAETLSADPELYRAYVSTSLGEFTVAKDQNVRFRSGWFSDRSATYLAAGRPVVTQDTGFGAALPTGRGLLAFDNLDSAAQALDDVLADPVGHEKAAREIARGYFDHRVVLDAMMASAGARRPHGLTPRPVPRGPLRPTVPHDLDLTPVSRHPIRLSPESEHLIRSLFEPEDREGTLDAEHGKDEPVSGPASWVEGRRDPVATIVVLTHNQLDITRLCLASVLRNTECAAEIIVVDNASTDGTPAFLTQLAARDERIRLILNDENRGFAAGNNQALRTAVGRTLVLLNNDTVVPPGWLRRLREHLRDDQVGAVGPVTNRIGNEAEVETTYRTYGGFLDEASARAGSRTGESFLIPTLTMFCFAFDRRVFREVGPLDESFGIGTLEDDDYSMRLAELGLGLRCAEDVLVHHFGRASFGELVESGDYGRLLARNQERFAAKWGRSWTPYARRTGEAYASLAERLRVMVDQHVPERSTVLVVSRGDDELLELGGREGWHLPRGKDGVYAGYYPKDSREAIDHLEDLKARGGEFLVLPTPSEWWLEFYAGLREHLRERYRRVARDEATGTIYSLREVES